MENSQTKIITHNLLYEELTPDLQLLADSCGLETVNLLINRFRGQQIYIQKLPSYPDYVKRYVREHPLHSTRRISRDLGVSEGFIRKIHLMGR